jgi:O-antigen/teichoic acid export membrane protein
MSYYAKKLAFGSMLGVANHLATIVVALFLMPFVVSSLGDRMYGFWTLASAFIGYYGLLDFGLSSAVGRFIAGAIGSGDKEECNRITSNSFFIFSCLGLVVLIITLVLSLLAFLFFTDPEEVSLFRKVILVLGVNVAINFPIKVCKGIVGAQLQFEVMALIRFISLALRTALFVIVLLKGYKILALAVVTLISCIPEYVLYAYYAKKYLPDFKIKMSDCNLGTVKSLFSYSSHAFIIRIADEMRFNIDAFVISAYIGLSAVTHYRVASTLVQHFITLILTIMGVLLPFFSRLDGEKNNEKIKETLLFSTRISVIITSFVGFGLIAWGQPFIERWMGPGYLDAYPCLVLLVIGCVFDLWQAPTVSLLYGIAKHRFYSLYNSLEAVCNLVLSLLLVKRYGILGIAIGTFIPMAVMKLLIQPVYACRVTGIAYWDYVKKISRTIFIVSIALLFPIFMTDRLARPDYLNLMGVGILSMVAFLLVLWKLEFNPEEKSTMMKLFSLDVLFKKSCA